jgi:hypothetical protein
MRKELLFLVFIASFLFLMSIALSLTDNDINGKDISKMNLDELNDWMHTQTWGAGKDFISLIQNTFIDNGKLQLKDDSGNVVDEISLDKIQGQAKIRTFDHGADWGKNIEIWLAPDSTISDSPVISQPKYGVQIYGNHINMPNGLWLGQSAIPGNLIKDLGIQGIPQEWSGGTITFYKDYNIIWGSSQYGIKDAVIIDTWDGGYWQFYNDDIVREYSGKSHIQFDTKNKKILIWNNADNQRFSINLGKNFNNFFQEIYIDTESKDVNVWNPYNNGVGLLSTFNGPKHYYMYNGDENNKVDPVAEVKLINVRSVESKAAITVSKDVNKNFVVSGGYIKPTGDVDSIIVDKRSWNGAKHTGPEGGPLRSEGEASDEIWSFYKLIIEYRKQLEGNEGALVSELTPDICWTVSEERLVNEGKNKIECSTCKYNYEVEAYFNARVNDGAKRDNLINYFKIPDNEKNDLINVVATHKKKIAHSFTYICTNTANKEGGFKAVDKGGNTLSQFDISAQTAIANILGNKKRYPEAFLDNIDDDFKDLNYESSPGSGFKVYNTIKEIVDQTPIKLSEDSDKALYDRCNGWCQD